LADFYQDVVFLKSLARYFVNPKIGAFFRGKNT
jgi:hypothetical protein